MASASRISMRLAIAAACALGAFASPARVEALSPLGMDRQPDPALRPTRHDEPQCPLHEVLAARTVVITHCEKLMRCLLGACQTQDEPASWPSMCMDYPLLMIEYERVGAERRWTWYPFVDGEVSAGIGEDEITRAIDWGRAFEATIEPALATETSDARVHRLLALLDPPPAPPSFSDCLDDWAQLHVSNLVVWSLFDEPLDHHDAWLALREWFALPRSAVQREPIYDRLYVRWRRTPEFQRAEFAALTRQVLEQRIAEWAELRSRGYIDRDPLPQRFGRDRWLLAIAHELHTRRARKPIDRLEFEICNEWTAAREAGAIHVNVACDAGPRPSASSCSVADDGVGWPICTLSLLSLVAWSRRVLHGS